MGDTSGFVDTSHKLALVGCGQWGTKIARTLSALRVLHCVSDINEENATGIIESYNTRFQNWHDVLVDPEITAVVIATPPEHHETLAREVLEARKHVFVEKPLALSEQGARSIASAVESSKKLAMVGHVFRYHPGYLRLRSLIRSGKLGKLKHIVSTRFNMGRIRQTGHIFWHLAPHDVSMILDLAGEYPLGIQSDCSNHLQRCVADFASARLTFESGLCAEVRVSWLYPVKERKLVIVGDNGMAVFDDCKSWDEKLVFFKCGIRWIQGQPIATESAGIAVPLNPAEPLYEEMSHFLKCISEGKQPETDVHESIAVVKVLEAMQDRTSNVLRTDVEQVLSSYSKVDSETKDDESSDTPLPLIDLEAQRKHIMPNIIKNLNDVIMKHDFIMGSQVRLLEEKLERFTRSPHVVTCANGTDAITLSLMALGVQTGDAILVPAFTFVATIEPIVLLGATPIIVDVEPHHLTLDPELVEDGVRLAKAVGCTPRGIIAVDIFGHPADYPSMTNVASRHDLWIIADSAQSFGATIGDQRVGTLATITTTSFFPSKPLGCYGDGGAIFTHDETLAGVLTSLRAHGRGHDKFESVRTGLNSRLDTMQAAILLAKMDMFEKEITARQEVARFYRHLLRGLVDLPETRPGVVSAWASFTIQTSNPKGLRSHLDRRKISSSILYPHPLHMQPAYREFPVVGDRCPNAERAAERVLSLPMHAYLNEESQTRVRNAIQDFFLE
ncbi:hypothetical protein QQS21_004865 [Conoideocrella luteorostrata]|uniref:Uncharacterized protein n=1 Tax=Conoideocrella luteorostrata TaxID=1105319 RepID=A0AAJ0G1A3_9HYPO|nr:hypothetical protein QQS21_004865 [Conoideocrella luteorostrata]